MARPGPWSVKGVDEEARQLAREAAAREGLTIGAWIDRAIRTRTGNLPGDRALPPETSEASSTATAVPLSDNVTELRVDRPEPAKAASPPASPETDASSETATAPEPTPEKPTPEKPTPEKPTPGRPPLDKAAGAPPRIDPAAAANANRTAQAHADRSQRSSSTIRPLAAAVAILAVGGLGVWAYSVLGPAPDQAAAPGAQQTASAPATGNPATPTAGQSAPSEPESRIAALRKAAEEDDLAAQFDLGVLHMRGDEVAQNPEEAARWFERAAKRGLAAAQYNYGTMLLAGNGVKTDEKDAFFWFQSAAEQSHAKAQYNLGAMYLSGRGAPQDYAKAADWFTRAADQGDAEALYSLGVMHENGYGMKRDQQMATAFYSRALAAGSAQAADKMTPETAQAAGSTAEATAVPVPPRSQEAAAVANIAPAAGTPAPENTTPGEPLGSDGIADIQRLLGKLDLGPGPADGVLGNRTVEAIKMYQRFAGLPVDGQPTQGLLTDLRQVVSAMDAERPAATKDAPNDSNGAR